MNARSGATSDGNESGLNNDCPAPVTSKPTVSVQAHEARIIILKTNGYLSIPRWLSTTIQKYYSEETTLPRSKVLKRQEATTPADKWPSRGEVA